MSEDSDRPQRRPPIPGVATRGDADAHTQAGVPMSLDAPLPLNPLAESAPQRPLWSALSRWWSPAATAADPVLGYESALPWTLGADAPAEAGTTPY